MNTIEVIDEDAKVHLLELKSDLTRIAETISTSRVQLIQEQSILKLMLMSYTTSNCGVLRLLGKVRR
jgi:hypothetical protein